MHLIAEINLAADNSTRFKILSSNRKHWCLTVCSYILWANVYGSLDPHWVDVYSTICLPYGSTSVGPSVPPVGRLWKGWLLWTAPAQKTEGNITAPTSPSSSD